MKNTFKLASLSLILAVITSMSAHAASSVRAFGGAGMYNSAASASGATSGGTTATKPTSKPSAAMPSRGGSVRVTPTSGVGGTAVKPVAGTATAGRVSSLPRLSVGSHIGSNSIGGGGSSVRPGTEPGVSGEDFEDFKEDLGDLAYEDTVTDELIDEKSILYQLIEALTLVGPGDGSWVLVNNNGTLDMYEIVDDKE